MSLILGQLRQHTVEFIAGTGIVFDGVRTDASSTSGSWTWHTPDGCLSGYVDGCGGGGGGGGGSSSTTEAAGGGGGGSAMSVTNFPIYWAKSAILTISLGAAGTGGAVATAGTSGGDTTITGLLSNTMLALPFAGAAGEFRIAGGIRGFYASTTSSSGGGGGGAANGQISYSLANGTTAQTNGATALNGNHSNEYVQGLFGGTIYALSGAGGGNATTSVTTAGGNGGGYVAGFIASSGIIPTVQSGGQNGTASWGGGGLGGASLFGMPGVGATGLGVAPANATGFGAGGTGGNGQAAGSNGSIGYLKITYWSAV